MDYIRQKTKRKPTNQSKTDAGSFCTVKWPHCILQTNVQINLIHIIANDSSVHVINRMKKCQ